VVGGVGLAGAAISSEGSMPGVLVAAVLGAYGGAFVGRAFASGGIFTESSDAERSGAVMGALSLGLLFVLGGGGTLEFIMGLVFGSFGGTAIGSWCNGTPESAVAVVEIEKHVVWDARGGDVQDEGALGGIPDGRALMSAHDLKLKEGAGFEGEVPDEVAEEEGNTHPLLAAAAEAWSQCSICEAEVPPFGAALYPNCVCEHCAAKAVNVRGEPATQSGDFNIGDNPVFIDGIKCFRRYKFGGAVTMRDIYGCADRDEYDRRATSELRRRQHDQTYAPYFEEMNYVWSIGPDGKLVRHKLRPL
jgi:hypothetical protein